MPRQPAPDVEGIDSRSPKATAWPMRLRAHWRAELLGKVGLAAGDLCNRYPHGIPGGSVSASILRGAAGLVAAAGDLDEAVSALDKSVEAQVLTCWSISSAKFG